MTKQGLRKVYKEKRQALLEAEFHQFNIQLYNSFFSHIDLSFIKVLNVFLPIEEKKEPDTWLIVDRVRREFPHVRLSVPKVNTETNALEHFFYEGMHQLQKNDWGIWEPKQGVPTPIEKIDMVLVPLLAFDKQGHRVGYGKGFYDKFLSQCRLETQKIGLSFFDPVNSIPSVESDITLNGCLTPNRYYRF